MGVGVGVGVGVGWVWVWVVLGQWRAACLGRPFKAQRKRGAVADAVHEWLLQLLPAKLDDAIVDLYAVGGRREGWRAGGMAWRLWLSHGGARGGGELQP